MKINLPTNVKFIIDKLAENGFEAYAVGGCVRDSILGLEPKDWDVTTSALPEQIKSCFEGHKQLNIGEKHGTITVILDKEPYEITTYRIDGDYSDGRHPDEVSFTDKIELDLARRDFTINAMAYNDEKGLIDPFNGQRDIGFKALRCVGDPDLRFGEDALRIMRALRFASVYNLSIERNTAVSLMKNRLLLNNIAEERIAVELNKLLIGKNVKYILRRYKEVFAVFLPELVGTFTCEQNTPHHNKNVWRHISASVEKIEPDAVLRMVMLLHDIGKPLAKKTDKNGRDHFKGHPHYSAVLGNTALKRLKYSNAFINQVVLLVEYHDALIKYDRSDLNAGRKFIKFLLNKIGTDNFRLLLKIHRADVLAQSMYKRDEKLLSLEHAEKVFEDIIAKNECFTIRALKINGGDLIHLGISSGKQIGEILEALLAEVMSDETENHPVDLKKRALEMYNEKLNKI